MSAADDASWAASAFAVAPADLGGVCLRSLEQPARSQWLSILRELMPPATPMRRIPFNIPDGRLLGGLDLAATLHANRPVAERGVLAATDGGVVLVAMAERLSAHTAACLNAVLDHGSITAQREGVSIDHPARVGVVALDESMGDDERVPASLLDRLSFLVDLNGFDLRTPLAPLHDAAEVAAARTLLPQVTIDDEVLAALCATALALGAGSVRVSLLASRVACIVAALEGRTIASAQDAAIAGRLVLAPRATILPRAPEQTEPTEQTEQSPSAPDPPTTGPSQAPPPESGESPEDPRLEPPSDQELQDIVLAAVQAAIPSGLLARLRAEKSNRSGGTTSGRVGAVRSGGARGRPAGVRSGAPRGRARLNVLETLRAAAPWQRLRGRGGDSRIRIETADFRITRHEQRAPTLTIFAVDASGSAALNRLAEAKGAVELLLADCYVRRDQVAVVTFRGKTAELLLPPTRSLVRAKKNLAGVPGGGGTPLAAALDCLYELAHQARRRGETPLLVILSDGRANVARGGAGGRELAHADAMKAAAVLRSAALSALFIDTSPRPHALAQELAGAMNARYVPLPFANARALSNVVSAVAAAERPAH